MPFQIKPTDEERFTLQQLIEGARLGALMALTEVGEVKKEITQHAGIKKYGSGRFMKWLETGRLKLYRKDGSHYKYLLIDCEALLVEDSFCFVKHVKPVKT